MSINNKTTSRPTYADIDIALELVGAHTSTDAFWILGGELHKVKIRARDKMNTPIKVVGHSLLIRALQEHPEYAPVPAPMPTIAAVFERAKNMHERARAAKPELPSFSHRLFGLLLGLSGWSMTKYITKKQPVTVSIQRTLYAMNMALDAGLSGYLEWVDMVQEEARARGFADFRTLLANTNWVLKESSNQEK